MKKIFALIKTDLRTCRITSGLNILAIGIFPWIAVGVRWGYADQ